MQETNTPMKQRRISLAFKLNLLITAIVLVVSAILISITYHAYTKTAYSQLHERLDKVNAEILPEKLAQCGALSALTRLEGFDDTRAAAAAEGNSDPLFFWMQGYWIQTVSGSYRTAEEQEAAMDAAIEQARQAGVPEVETFDWIIARDQDLFLFQDASACYYSLAHSLSDQADTENLSHIRVYAELPQGYVQLFDAIPSRIKGDSYDSYLPYGVVSTELASVEQCKEQPEERYISFLSDEGSELAILTYAEAQTQDGAKVPIWFVYSCNSVTVEEGRRDFLLRSLLMVGLLVAAALVLSLMLLRRIAVRPLRKLAKAVDAFDIGAESSGQKTPIDLDLSSNDEIGDLCRNFRNMTTRIFEDAEHLTRITAERERISTELDLAARIQTDMLPNVFPPFPERKEFDLFASMDPAKEVGGDFYDFFLVDDDHLALVIADVSGKGVPAALFMMISKIMVQNLAKTGLSPAKLLDELNAQILENNSEDMFVTVWLGLLEISTGRLTAANAGHEYPFLLQPGEGFALYKDPHSFVVGSMPDMDYREYELQLSPGSKLFVYTDGVLEATNAKQELFGSERLLATLNTCTASTPKEILRQARHAVDAFVGDAEQFDDLTMLCLEYRGDVAPYI